MFLLGSQEIKFSYLLIQIYSLSDNNSQHNDSFLQKQKMQLLSWFSSRILLRVLHITTSNNHCPLECYYYFTAFDFFPLAFDGGLSLEAEGQQLSSGIQDSPRYSRGSPQFYGLGGLDFSCDFQFLQSFSPAFGHRSMRTNYYCWEIKHISLLLGELSVELSRITCELGITCGLVMWHFKKRVLALFGSRHRPERTCLLSPLLRTTQRANYPSWTISLQILTAAIGLLVLWDRLSTYFTLWDGMSFF